MDNKDELIITAPFDDFFDVLILKKSELRKKRQDLIKTGAIVKADGDDRVFVRECAKYVLDELDTLHMKVMASHSHDDLLDYSLTSLNYLRTWYNFLVSVAPSEYTSMDSALLNDLKDSFQEVKDDLDRLFKHLYAALKLYIEHYISANCKGETIDEDDEIEISFPFDSFMDTIKANGQELKTRHQDLIKGDVVVEFNGTKYVMLFKYICNILSDLICLCSEAKKSRSEEAIEDFTFFANKYLEILTHLILSPSQLVTLSGDQALNALVWSPYYDVFDGLQAIYKFASAAVMTSLENGPLASSKE